MPPAAPDDWPRTAEFALTVIKSLNMTERTRLFEALDEVTSPAFEAGFIVWPKALSDHLEDTVHRGIEGQKELIKMLVKYGNELARWINKSKPENIHRNIEICDLRRKDPGLWSLNRLGKHFSLKKPTIQRIVKREDHWRRLAAKLAAKG